jgi:hypothetical protein
MIACVRQRASTPAEDGELAAVTAGYYEDEDQLQPHPIGPTGKDSGLTPQYLGTILRVSAMAARRAAAAALSSGRH